MTSTLTLSCPEGIVLATDCRITLVDQDGNISGYKDGIDKIYQFSKSVIGMSYWGLASFSSATILQHLKKFETSQVTEKDNVHSISEKLKSYLEGLVPKIDQGVGIHVAGYCVGENGKLYPQIRHVFHVSWHKPGQFTNENSNEEYHLQDGTKRTHPYDPFIALFNGDNAIANSFFNFVPNVFPKRRRQIILDLLTINQAIDLAKLTIRTSGEILDFLYTIDKEKAIPTVRGLQIAKITKEKGFSWVQKS